MFVCFCCFLLLQDMFIFAYPLGQQQQYMESRRTIVNMSDATNLFCVSLQTIRCLLFLMHCMLLTCTNNTILFILKYKCIGAV